MKASPSPRSVRLNISSPIKIVYMPAQEMSRKKWKESDRLIKRLTKLEYTFRRPEEQREEFYIQTP